MSNTRHIFNDAYNSLIRLVKQGVRARLGSIGRAKEDDDAVPLDQLMELLASAGGSSWTSGAGAPSAPASNGELYLNTSNGDVYQYVDPTGWGSPIMNLVGADGTKWFSDFGDPVAAGITGMIEGDHYLDLFSGDVYKYESGSWGSSYINLTGPSGVPGTSGSRWYSDSGNPNTLGQTFVTTGDHYLDTDNGNYYKSNGSSPNFWVLQGNLTGPPGSTGPAGATGATGAPGAAGSVWYHASGPPSAGTGIVGDWALDTLTGNYYEKTGASTWTLRGNLTGPAYSDYAIVPGTASSFSGFASNIELDLSAGSVVLTNCIFLGAGETIVFPNGYTATGKTFISGVSSNFEYSLDLTKGAIYDATAFGGVGEVTIPSGLEFIGKFIFIKAFVTCALIQGLDSWCGAVEFTVNDVADGVYLSTVTPVTMTTAGECVTDIYYGGAAIGITSFDFTGAPYGYCKLLKSGDKNLVTERVGY